MDKIDLKVKHFITPNGIETVFADTCGCPIERAVSEELQVPIDHVYEGIDRIQILKVLDKVYNQHHERYTLSIFTADLHKARDNKENQELIIRTIQLEPYEERDQT